MPTITPAELKALCEQGSVELLDVRTPLEFGGVHVVGAKNVPLDQLDPAGDRGDKSRPVYVICRSGARGAKACAKLAAAGFTNAINVDGGTLACERAGLPVVRGKKVLSLERQVQVTAGGIALVGAVLAVAVHPWFAVVPAVIGAGLVLTGVTGSCLMGLVMAKMPWNRRAACGPGV